MQQKNAIAEFRNRVFCSPIKIGWQAAIKFALARKLEKLERNVDEPTYSAMSL